MARLVALFLMVLALPAAGCGDGDGEDSPDKSPGGADATSQSAGAKGCERVESPEPKPDGGEKRPTTKLDPAKTYDVRLRTSCGDFTVRLDQRSSPDTAASFVALAKKGFFNGTVFHRIVPDFVIQGGDPTGTGTGGPGYSTRDEPPANAVYTRGVVAMAKTEAEAPGTAGSQFYVVTGADAGLPAEYAILGKVVKGLDVTARIGRLGDPQSGGAGTPTQPVVIEKASVSAR